MSALSTRDASILEGIVSNCNSIEDRIERYRIDRSVFVEHADLREMVLFLLIQIGELANHLSPQALEAHSDVPWSDIVGMRHMIVHGYGTIDATWAWTTIAQDVPELKRLCSSILEDR